MNSTPHCENCSCPRSHVTKTTVPGHGSDLEFFPLFMAQSVHDMVREVVSSEKEFGDFYKGKLTLHFEYDPVYLRDTLITTWEAR